ncbi:MAG: insulinase family protein [Lachnospiraceae bacterium]|nr:insulinase family protein [Lachnospiraceae bacterium]
MIKIGENIHGFTLKNSVEVPEVNGTFYEMVHDKTGAKLGWLKTEDENKTFAITFKTVPNDDTGVFHILEHSVLQGSENYPVKSPMVELMKGSLSTFVNAITFSDKTIYPISSRNQKELENLTKVYLDAVFHPLIYRNKKIFLQEGWHYESNGQGEELFYNGVVLNEMRGATASAESLLYDNVQKELFPDNCYRFNSGGKPKAIPSLTYESFLLAHEKYYHPSNSLILLDGDMEIERLLPIIDKTIFEFEKAEVEYHIALQKPVISRNVSYDYAVEKKGKNQGYLGLAYVVGKYSDTKKAMAARLIAEYLTGSNDAPLSKTVISQKLGFNVSGFLVDGMLQNYLYFVVSNMEVSKRKELEQIIKETFNSISREGLSKEKLEAILCRHEFSYKEGNHGFYPAGVEHAIKITESWLYDGEPTGMFATDEWFATCRKEIKEGKFDLYFKEFLLYNKHCTSVMMNPSTTYLEEEREEEKRALKSVEEVCTLEERKNLWEEQCELKKWQETPNNEENIKKLPRLHLSDIEKEPFKVKSKRLVDGTMWHTVDTHGIQYVRCYFDLRRFEPRDISLGGFMAGLLGNLALNNMCKEDLEVKKNKYFGSMFAYIQTVTKVVNNEPGVYFTVDTSYLKNNEEEAISLLLNILKETDFKDKKVIREYLNQEYENLRQSMITDGQSMALLAAKSSISRESYYANLVSGPLYVQYITELKENYDSFAEELGKKMSQLLEEILKFTELQVGVTSFDESVELRAYLRAKLRNIGPIKTKDSEGKNLPIYFRPKGEKISIPAPISFAAMASNLNLAGIKNTGSWLVFSKIASMDYLWNQIRVLGGAYGAGMQIDNTGMVYAYSYRDPNPRGSIKAFRLVADYMKQAVEKDINLEPFIIGTIASTEPLISPSNKGKTADLWELSGITRRARRKRRREILETTTKDLVKLAEEYEKLISCMEFAVVGNLEALKELENM